VSLESRHMLFLILSAVVSNAQFGPAATEAWNDYVLQTMERWKVEGIQADCIPRRYQAHGEYKGVVVLHHGFSACPQQYFDLAPLLSAEGFDVLLPLMPGQGLNYTEVNGTFVDNFSNLPWNSSVYATFNNQINQVVQLAGGEKVVLGLSVGGSVAAGAAQAVDRNGRGIYDRAVVANPLLHAANLAADLLLNVVFTVPGLAKKTFSWGPGCDKERGLGRAGICTMNYGALAAARNYGKDLLQDNNTVPSNTAVQVLYDIKDPVVNTKSVQYFFKSHVPASGSMCTLPQDAGHSFLSRHDTPSANKWWLQEVTCRLVSFLTQTSVDPGDLEDGFMAKKYKSPQRCSGLCAQLHCCPMPLQNGSVPPSHVPVQVNTMTQWNVDWNCLH